MRPVLKVVGLVGILLLIWSTLFVFTFHYPFYWDDYHLIRPYTGSELLSVFHGVVDPDKIETPGLRPVSIILYNLQGLLLGEHVVLQRIFMLALMGVLLCAVGILLFELGLHFVQIAIAFALFVFSRVFASLVLWISLSHVILAYIFIALTACFFVIWTKRQRGIFFVAMLTCAIVATFNREETYTLPIVLPLLWLISSPDRAHWRAVLLAALGLLVIVCFHYWLWHFLIPQALSPRFTLGAAGLLLKATAASWLPGGFTMIGFTDKLIGLSWVAFLVALILIFLTTSRARGRWQFLGVCCVGVILSLPAIGVARPFGIALPTLAFMTALSIAIVEVYHRVQFRQASRYAFLATVAFGLALGIGGGVRRSFYVAESLQQNCAVRAERDGEFLFDLFKQPATIPEARRQAGIARLSALGIKSRQDAKRLQVDLTPITLAEYKSIVASRGQDESNQEEPWRLLFQSKYEYLSF
jgi:hypothetical protein